MRISESPYYPDGLSLEDIENIEGSVREELEELNEFGHSGCWEPCDELSDEEALAESEE